MTSHSHSSGKMFLQQQHEDHPHNTILSAPTRSNVTNLTVPLSSSSSLGSDSHTSGLLIQTKPAIQQQQQTTAAPQQQQPRRYADLLTVFQAAPLVWEDIDTGELHPLGSLDFEHERNILESALQNTHIEIDVVFDIATTDRLGAFLARGQGRVLHFSCHGHEDYLVIDNGWGKVQPLLVADLKDWIQTGGDNLQFVFVSACYSRKAGEAFVAAGVPHVVCCQQDDHMLRDVAAVEFSRAFYQALACGCPLNRAFELGQQQVRNCPELERSEREAEVSKFILLPEHEDHSVQIFSPDDDDEAGGPSSPTLTTNRRRPFRQHSARSLMGSRSSSSLMEGGFSPSGGSSSLSASHPQQRRSIPYPPHVFEGRQVDVFRLLDALKSARLVRVTGPEGIGKVSLTSAACHYMQERRHNFPHQIMWLPTPVVVKHNNAEEDMLSNQFSQLFDMLHSECSLEQLDRDPLYHNCCHGIAASMHNQRLVLVLDARKLSRSHVGIQKIVSFLSYLIQTTQHVKAIVVHHVGELSIRSALPVIEKDVYLKPLDYKSSILLFGRLCQHVTARRCPMVGNHKELLLLLLPEDPATEIMNTPPRSSRCREIYKMTGEGIPAKIHSIAKTMDAKEYDKLIALGMRKEQKLEFSTRAEFDRRLEELNQELKARVRDREWLKAQECQELLDEMEVIKEALPDCQTLISMRDSSQLDLELSIQARDFITADRMQKQLDAIQEKLKAEREARKSLGLDGPMEEDEEDGKAARKTRAELSAEIDKLEAQLEAASDANDIREARRLDEIVVRLKRERDTMPSTEMLLLNVSELEHDLKMAKGRRDWDEAERLLAKLQKTQERLRIERQAEEDHGLKKDELQDMKPEAAATKPGAVAVEVASLDSGNAPIASARPPISKQDLKSSPIQPATAEATTSAHSDIVATSSSPSASDGVPSSGRKGTASTPVPPPPIPVAKPYQKKKRSGGMRARRSFSEDLDLRRANSVSFASTPPPSQAAFLRRVQASTPTTEQQQQQQQRSSTVLASNQVASVSQTVSSSSSTEAVESHASHVTEKFSGGAPLSFGDEALGDFLHGPARTGRERDQNANGRPWQMEELVYGSDAEEAALLLAEEHMMMSSENEEDIRMDDIEAGSIGNKSEQSSSHGNGGGNSVGGALVIDDASVFSSSADGSASVAGFASTHSADGMMMDESEEQSTIDSSWSRIQPPVDEEEDGKQKATGMVAPTLHRSGPPGRIVGSPRPITAMATAAAATDSQVTPHRNRIMEENQHGSTRPMRKAGRGKPNRSRSKKQPGTIRQHPASPYRHHRQLEQQQQQMHPYHHVALLQQQSPLLRQNEDDNEEIMSAHSDWLAPQEQVHETSFTSNRSSSSAYSASAQDAEDDGEQLASSRRLSSSASSAQTTKTAVTKISSRSAGHDSMMIRRQRPARAPQQQHPLRRQSSPTMEALATAVAYGSMVNQAPGGPLPPSAAPQPYSLSAAFGFPQDVMLPRTDNTTMGEQFTARQEMILEQMMEAEIQRRTVPATKVEAVTEDDESDDVLRWHKNGPRGGGAKKKGKIRLPNFFGGGKNNPK